MRPLPPATAEIAAPRRSNLPALLAALLLAITVACDSSLPATRPAGDGGADHGPARADGAGPPSGDAAPDAPGAPADGQPPPESPAFVRGYNFGDGTVTVTVDGRELLGEDVGGSSSLRLTAVGGGPLAAWKTTISPADFVPPASEALAALLNEHHSVSQGGLRIEQGLTDGSYQVYTYHMENNAEPPRAFHLAVQGTVVTNDPVAPAVSHWVRLGPFAAEVTGGVLELELQQVTGDASIAGLEIFTTTGGQVADLPAPQAPPGWKLVWSDEFDQPGLPDPSRWDYEEGYVRNSELQYYTRARKEDARVEGGKLVIEARQDNFQGHEISSASVITKGKFAFRYGRVEVRAKLPTGLGSWPAIWTLGTNIDAVGWPKCGEIDIMENVGFAPDTIHGTVHMTGPDGAHTGRGGTFAATAPYSTFHVYGIEWRADRIDFFVDGTKYFTFNKGEPGTVWAFDVDQYLLINLAFGGGWGGQQGVDKSILPLRYEVDYVRVYEQAP